MIPNSIIKLLVSFVFLLLGGGFFYKFFISSSPQSTHTKKKQNSSETPKKSDRSLLDIIQDDNTTSACTDDDKEKISLFDYLTEVEEENLSSDICNSSLPTSHSTKEDQQLISEPVMMVNKEEVDTSIVEQKKEDQKLDTVQITIEDEWEIVDLPNVKSSSPKTATRNVPEPSETHLQVHSDSKRDSIELSVNQEEFSQVYKTVSSVLKKKHSPTSVEVTKDSNHLNTSHEEFDLAEEETAWTWTDVVSDEENDEEEEEEQDEQDHARESLLREEFIPTTYEEQLKMDEMKKMNEKRKNILSEILTTEEYYVKGLIILTGVYKKQIEQKKIVDPKILKIIFQDVEIVNNVNQKFLEELRKIYEKEKSLIRNLDPHQQQQVQSSLGELLNTYAHSFKLYSSYIAGYKKAAATFSEEKKRNKKLCKLLDSIKQLLKQQGERITNMESYLVTPIQRIPRYRLLVEDLVKHTPDNDPTRPKLIEALELIKSIAIYVNEAETKVENIQVTSHMVHKFKLKGFIRPSRFIIDYWSQENSASPFIQCRVDGKILNCELYIFNDVLVLHKNYDSFLYSKVDIYFTRKGYKQTTKHMIKDVKITTATSSNPRASLSNSGGNIQCDTTLVSISWNYENSHSTKELTFLTTSMEDATRLENSLRKSVD
ncbi:hypothetical protein C9374_008324 [Naegleria lovaniensis]|uniref:DH domain-containing protein n=1 Tax=Naegleria lovaniensis TaxID=51637 RepID=A0AA88GJ72_NAELO|nr:uncharacterized protein C9374_008324 [Naegleria lovaniensis]KAG2378181.1 hypothetical protein C9374_008324 [Naegleria lovaniensis]